MIAPPIAQPLNPSVWVYHCQFCGFFWERRRTGEESSKQLDQHMRCPHADKAGHKSLGVDFQQKLTPLDRL